MNTHLICLNCDSEQFAPGEAEVRQEFRGETLMVKTPVMICLNCAWHTVGNDQIDELRRRTADTYRKKHNLLTSAQIRAMRDALGMNQSQFAAFLRVGVASVKRWETWLVQEASSDELIRVKCQLAEQTSSPAEFSHYYFLPSKAPVCIAGTDFIQVTLQTLPVFPAAQPFQWREADHPALSPWLTGTLWSQTYTWPQPQTAMPPLAPPFCGPVQPPLFSERSPPDICDASRFSFPMPSRPKKASEKKTIMIQCK
jgi:putative zinc finger/helix-turn-helix YgiT family protein